MNDYLSLTYPSVDSLCSMIRDNGQSCHIFKLDLKRVYRLIPVDPSDYPFLTYQLRVCLFADTMLPFGLRLASMACQRTITTLSHIHDTHNYLSGVYLDYHYGSDTSVNALHSSSDLLNILHNAGSVKVKHAAESASPRMTFLDEEFDARRMTMEATHHRLEGIRPLLLQWANRKSRHMRQLQSLIGISQFVANYVIPGRPYIARLPDLLRTAISSNLYFTLNIEFRKAFEWLAKFPISYNGVSIIHESIWSRPDGSFRV